MQFSRTHIGIALGAGGLVVLVFLGFLMWLNNQPPVLARSDQRDPLTGMPLSITMNPLRDRTLERTANAFIVQMRDGHCAQLLAALGEGLPQETRQVHLRFRSATPADFLEPGGMGRRSAAGHFSLPGPALLQPEAGCDI